MYLLSLLLLPLGRTFRLSRDLLQLLLLLSADASPRAHFLRPRRKTREGPEASEEESRKWYHLGDFESIGSDTLAWPATLSREGMGCAAARTEPQVVTALMRHRYTPHTSIKLCTFFFCLTEH